MTDEEFLFRQTERERKRNARGDYNKKRQGGRHVRLPSDGLTRKELQSMNGECFKYELNKPVKWDYFSIWPEDIQREYIIGLREKFGATSGQLAFMFGVARPTIWKRLTKLGLEHDGARPTADNIAKFEAFCNPAPRNPTPIENAPVEPKQEPVHEYIPGDADKLCEILRLLKGTGARITIEITV